MSASPPGRAPGEPAQRQAGAPAADIAGQDHRRIDHPTQADLKRQFEPGRKRTAQRPEREPHGGTGSENGFFAALIHQAGVPIMPNPPTGLSYLVNAATPLPTLQAA